jgi:PQQ-like domain
MTLRAARSFPSILRFRIACVVGVALVNTFNANAQLTPVWTTRQPLPNVPGAGLARMVTDAVGNSYGVSTSGDQNNWGIRIVKVAPEGTILWTSEYDSVGSGDEQGRCIAIAADGNIVVGGNTPGAFQYADALVIKLDAATGSLIWESMFDWDLFSSDAAMEIATAADGGIYFGGHCNNGDGLDCLTVKLDASGNTLWAKNWDGPAFGPFSQEAVRGLKVAPDGHVIMMTEGTQASNHPDYVLVKYNSTDGSILWESKWGVNGYDEPIEMVLDAAGDIYVTGLGINISNQVSTVKFHGSDGAILWQAYDALGAHIGVGGIDLDPVGGVYVSAKYDPDGDKSNGNDNIFVFKRDADTGEHQWTFQYGANCLFCGEASSDIRIDAQRNVLVLGRTSSPPYSGDQILFVLDPDTGVEVARGVETGGANETANGFFIQFDTAQNIYIGGNFSNVNTALNDLFVMKYAALDAGCYADCDADGSLTIDDFICLQTLFALADPYADCDADGALSIDDFICFQTLFAIGC